MSAFLPRSAFVLMVLALLVAAVSLAGAELMARNAQLVQRVAPNSEAGAALFGPSGEGTQIGSPQLLIVHDEGAFLPGIGVDGARLVSEQYLREREIYPLQAKTVWFVRNMLLLGSLALLAVSVSLRWWATYLTRG